MEVNTQAYLETLNLFYSKITRNHTNKAILKQKFTSFGDEIETKYESNRLNKSLHKSMNKSRSKVDLNKSRSKVDLTPNKDIENTSFRGKSIRKGSASNPSVQKVAIDKMFQCSWIFITSHVHRIIVLSAFYGLITTANFLAFKNIENTFLHHLPTNNLFKQNDLSFFKFQWKKISQFFEVKKKIQWEQQLFKIIKKLEKFDQNVVKMLASLLVQERNLDDMDNLDQAIKSMSEEIQVQAIFFKISQTYFVTADEDFDSQSFTLFLGYLESEKKYVLSNKLPEFTRQNAGKKQQFQLIWNGVSEMLNTYKKNTEKLMQLNIFKDDLTKESRVKSYLANKS